VGELERSNLWKNHCYSYVFALTEVVFTFKLLKKEKLNSITMLKNLYLKGNSNEITSILQLLNKFEGTNKEVGKKFEKLLLFDRNHRIAKKIHQVFTEMPAKSHFIVAGTLHYLGDHNVVDLLRKQGYTVTREIK
jgi:uncharacterized protein YbaP (TraB family)